MPTVISGILKDGMGKPIPNCTIELKALRTSTTVITKTIASQQPEKNGSYSMNVELGKYGVTLCVEGFPPNYVGEIYVHSGSVPGTLNYYLGLPTEGDLPPAAIQQFEAMVELVSLQSAQVGKDKAAAAKSAADALASQTAAKASETNAGKSAGAALVSEKAAKTSETNTAKGIEAAAASAQAAKLSETNADGSKKAAQTSAAEALASQGAAKTSETNAGNSAKAASDSADKAKTEADRATAATDGKQDENALLTAIAALNTAADQIITLTGKNSVETAVLTKFAKEMLAKTDADGVREYLGLKEALKIGDYGLGRGSRWLMSDLGWTSGFLMYNTMENEVPTNCAGWQSSYGNSRRAQLVMGTDNRLWARFSLSTEVVDTTTPWKLIVSQGDPLNFSGLGSNSYSSTRLSTSVMGGKTYLRKFRGGAGDSIYHETVQAGKYTLSVGNTDAQTVFSVEHQGGSNVDGFLGDKEIIKKGSYGLGWLAINNSSPTYQPTASMFSLSGGGAGNIPYGAGIYSMYNTVLASHIHVTSDGKLIARYLNNSKVVADVTCWTLGVGGNTTVDASGFIKKASPVINIFSNGDFEVNSESEGAIVERENIGVYRIKNTLGMNSDRAWGGTDGGFEIPKDRNGQRLLWLDYEIDADGSILVKTYHRTYPNAPCFARNIIGIGKDSDFTETIREGEPIDIPSDQFLQVRVEMPQDSIYNLRIKEDEEQRKLMDEIENNENES